MIIVGANNKQRMVYAEIMEGEFLLSPFPEVRGGRRPIARFDTKEELERHAANRRCEVQWQTS